MPWLCIGPLARTAAFLFLLVQGSAGALANEAGKPADEALAKESKTAVPSHHAALLQRAMFLTAERALQRGNTKRFDALVNALQGYALHPYLIEQRFRRYGRTPAAYARTLTALKETPLARGLENRWLRSLAAQQRWDDFLHYYNGSPAPDLQCSRARALLALGQKEEAFNTAQPLWLIGRSQHKACDPVFRAWRKSDLPTSLVVKRLELAFARGNRTLVRYLRGLLPENRRGLADTWLALRQRPQDAQKYAKRRIDGLDRILTGSLKRWAYFEPDRAIRAWPRLAEQRPTLERNALAAHFGALLFRRQRHREAEIWLREARPEDMTERMNEIRIFNQIALGKWPVAERLIAALPPELQAGEQWQYWQGRVALALGNEVKATRIWRPLAAQRSYYGYLAADRTNLPYQFNEEPIVGEPARLRALEISPAFRRARELHALGRVGPFRQEWRWLERAHPEHLLELAILAHRHGWFSRAILTLARAGELDVLKIRFPVLFASKLRERADALELNVPWLLATIRQESAFIPDARSHAGAIGLMQIMPATGRSLAKRLGIRRFAPSRLTEASLNIELGTRYLRQLLDEFGHPMLASAAYNAGPHRIRRWLPKTAMSADIWVETIPFKETRSYVKRVAYYRLIYANRINEAMPRLSQIFPEIRGTQS